MLEILLGVCFLAVRVGANALCTWCCAELMILSAYPGYCKAACFAYFNPTRCTEKYGAFNSRRTHQGATRHPHHSFFAPTRQQTIPVQLRRFPKTAPVLFALPLTPHDNEDSTPHPSCAVLYGRRILPFSRLLLSLDEDSSSSSNGRNSLGDDDEDGDDVFPGPEVTPLKGSLKNAADEGDMLSSSSSPSSSPLPSSTSSTSPSPSPPLPSSVPMDGGSVRRQVGAAAMDTPLQTRERSSSSSSRSRIGSAVGGGGGGIANNVVLAGRAFIDAAFKPTTTATPPVGGAEEGRDDNDQLNRQPRASSSSNSNSPSTAATTTANMSTTPQSSAGASTDSWRNSDQADDAAAADGHDEYGRVKLSSDGDGEGKEEVEVEGEGRGDETLLSLRKRPDSKSSDGPRSDGTSSPSLLERAEVDALLLDASFTVSSSSPLAPRAPGKGWSLQ